MNLYILYRPSLESIVSASVKFRSIPNFPYTSLEFSCSPALVGIFQLVSVFP